MGLKAGGDGAEFRWSHSCMSGLKTANASPLTHTRQNLVRLSGCMYADVHLMEPCADALDFLCSFFPGFSGEPLQILNGILIALAQYAIMMTVSCVNC